MKITESYQIIMQPHMPGLLWFDELTQLPGKQPQDTFSVDSMFTMSPANKHLTYYAKLGLRISQQEHAWQIQTFLSLPDLCQCISHCSPVYRRETITPFCEKQCNTKHV